MFKPALLALAAAAALSLPAAAHEVIYVATLSGSAESPPNTSPGTGTARVTIDLDLVTMRVEASFSGLAGNVTASHIHCCVAVPGFGTTGVATMTPSFVGFPLGVTSGSYDRTFDLTSASSYSGPFLNSVANGGSPANALNQLLTGMADGKAYLNIHTNLVPTGEIRGFLAPVPEPATYALLLGGLVLVGTAGRRRTVIPTT